MSQPAQRCGTVVVAGRANVGKSTLLNHVLGEKVSIVSPVPQTTRNIVRSLVTEDRGQIVFLDTPGMHRARGNLGRIMNKMARGAVGDADLVLLVFDGSARPFVEDDGWMRRLIKHDIPWLAAVNKSDVSTFTATAYQTMENDIRAELGSEARATWLEISAASGAGVDNLVTQLFARLPEGSPLFDEDMLSDYPRRLAIADIIREKLLAVLHEELPHAIAVHVEKLEEDDQRWRIEAEIYVNQASQKGIVIGHKGRLIRTAQRQATTELEEIYEVAIDLKLWVKVHKGWEKNFWLLRKLGYA